MLYVSAMQRLKEIFGTAVVLVSFAGGVWLGFSVRHWLKFGSGLREENTATVVEQVQTLSDLVTVKCVLEKPSSLKTRNGAVKIAYGCSCTGS
jgi:hypothetical protein